MGNIGAVILSAGRSARQNGFKPALAIGRDTALGHCMALFRKAGIEEVVVVLGHRKEELIPVVHDAGARSVINPDYESGMFSSVQAGVAELCGSMEAFFILPVDIPLVRGITLEIMAQRLEVKGVDAFVPAFNGWPGHPPLLRWPMRRAIAAHDGRRGLRGVLEKAETEWVAVPDRHVLLDIDTPDLYEKAKRLWQRHGIPSRDEAEALLGWACKDRPDVVRHCRAVCTLAKKMAEAVNEVSPAALDLDLVAAGAILHDIAKGSPGHAAAGAEMLRKWGFSESLCRIVSLHLDWEPEEGMPVTEPEVVYLADKLVQEGRPGSLHERYRPKYDLYPDKPGARQAVMRRWQQAQAVCSRVEHAMKRPMEDLL
jgi:putative nucleotidyltransferase with HDIG domain